MSAPALTQPESKNSAGTGGPSLELVRLSPRWQEGLRLFFEALRGNGDTRLFCPHPTDEKTISQLAHYAGRDLYYVLVEGGNVLGYGLLRGWDEGYEIPSLGVAIHSSARGYGLGRILISFLHMLASRRGATKVRLRVLKGNDKAKRLYESFGYVFEEDGRQPEYLVGFCNVVKGIEL
jgi:[ribosomal protein S18]-alanine N-acetyltransferase